VLLSGDALVKVAQHPHRRRNLEIMVFQDGETEVLTEAELAKQRYCFVKDDTVRVGGDGGFAIAPLAQRSVARRRIRRSRANSGVLSRRVGQIAAPTIRRRGANPARHGDRLGGVTRHRVGGGRHRLRS
jgi:hypothetical protein